MNDFDKELEILLDGELNRIRPDINVMVDKINLISIKLKIIPPKEFIENFDLNNKVYFIADFSGGNQVNVEFFYGKDLIDKTDESNDILTTLQNLVLNDKND